MEGMDPPAAARVHHLSGLGDTPTDSTRCGCRGDADLAHVDPIVQSCTATDKKVGSLLVASSDSQYQRATRIAQLCNSTLRLIIAMCNNLGHVSCWYQLEFGFHCLRETVVHRSEKVRWRRPLSSAEACIRWNKDLLPVL
jgi:hypothetical protein